MRGRKTGVGRARRARRACGCVLARVPRRRARVHPAPSVPLAPPPSASRIRLGGASPVSGVSMGTLRAGGGRAPARLVGLDDLVHAPPEDAHARRRHHQSRRAALGQVAARPNRRVASLGRHILRAKQHGAQLFGVRRAVRRAWRAWTGVGGVSLTICSPRRRREPELWQPLPLPWLTLSLEGGHFQRRGRDIADVFIADGLSSLVDGWGRPLFSLHARRGGGFASHDGDARPRRRRAPCAAVPWRVCERHAEDQRGRRHGADPHRGPRRRRSRPKTARGVHDLR